MEAVIGGMLRKAPGRCLPHLWVCRETPTIPRHELALVACGVVLFASALTAQQALATVFGSVIGGQTGSRVAPAGDMDGDSVPDFLVNSPNVGNGLVQIVSGATRVARNIANSGTGAFANAVMISAGDMNLDGVPDLVVNANNDLRGFSGANGAPLWQTTGFTFRAATRVGDLDQDGRADVAVIVYLSGNEFLWTLRGSNGSLLQSFAIPLGGNTADLVTIGDIDSDGIPEVARSNGGAVGSTASRLRRSSVPSTRARRCSPPATSTATAAMK